MLIVVLTDFPCLLILMTRMLLLGCLSKEIRMGRKNRKKPKLPKRHGHRTRKAVGNTQMDAVTRAADRSGDR